MGARRRLIAGAATLALAPGIAACGEDDFENNPRPPAPIELTALIDDKRVRVSPGEAGAGLVNLTISNQSRDEAALVLEGPTDQASEPIPPGGVGNMKVALEEGEYLVSAGDDLGVREGKLAVGPERPSSQNELLLP